MELNKRNSSYNKKNCVKTTYLNCLHNETTNFKCWNGIKEVGLIPKHFSLHASLEEILSIPTIWLGL